ncbi:hypothetical protein JW935_05245 [candidate division KSB1 bacterium]|nr:hypothetical protein [candidate division KSB1 bacterium]
MKRAIKLYYISTFILACCAYSQAPQWKSYTDGNIVTSLAVEGESVWIGYRYSGLAYLENPAGSLFYYNENNSGMPENQIMSIAIDDNGNKWIGTRGGGLVKFAGENWTVYNRNNSDLPMDRILTVL